MNSSIRKLTMAALLAASAPLVAQSSLAPAPLSAAAKSTPRAPEPSVDGGWPQGYVSPSGASIVLYQPQIASWPDQKHMILYTAVSYVAKDKRTPALGVLKVESDTNVALAERLVGFSEFTVTEASFPTTPKDEVKTIVDDILAAVPRDQRVISLDRVLAMVDTSQVTPHNIEGVKADPPPVYFSTTPAVLINLDGPPIWSPIPGTDLRFAVNTNWDLFLAVEPQSYYLRVDKSWLTASAVQGPWRQVSRLPASFSSLPDDGNWSDVRAALQPQTATALPMVLVSEQPAELLLLNGPPAYAPVSGTNLQWISNTDADVFRLGTKGTVYLLVSGRWFSASELSGPWTFATPSLPEDFKRIPLTHPRSRVLASVPGTRQAIEAVLLAQVPQTATVNRRAINPPTVDYQGAPQFEAIENTSVARAVNTDKEILKVSNMYYMCFEGVWFVSTAASGPWTVADAIPKEIYQIPISSPAHNVTYVTVERSDDDEVTFAAESAYTGMMVAWGTAVWGSGWYYPPYYYPGAFYPVYYPYYPSYGYGAHYNPWNGAYTRGAAAYGPAGARGAMQAYNPRTGAVGSTIQGSNVYGGWGSTAVKRGDQWAQTSRLTRNATGTTGRVTQGSRGGEAFTRRGPQGNTAVGRTGGGDVYAGRDGNIYRNQGGSWQKYGNGGWSTVDGPVGTAGQLRDRAAQSGLSGNTATQLNRDRSARMDGAQRTRDLNRAGRSGSGSYRPSGGRSFGGGGGGFRGGGGGFRGGGRR